MSDYERQQRCHVCGAMAYTICQCCGKPTCADGHLRTMWRADGKGAVDLCEPCTQHAQLGLVFQPPQARMA